MLDMVKRFFNVYLSEQTREITLHGVIESMWKVRREHGGDVVPTWSAIRGEILTDAATEARSRFTGPRLIARLADDGSCPSTPTVDKYGNGADRKIRNGYRTLEEQSRLAVKILVGIDDGAKHPEDGGKLTMASVRVNKSRAWMLACVTSAPKPPTEEEEWNAVVDKLNAFAEKYGESNAAKRLAKVKVAFTA